MDNSQLTIADLTVLHSLLETACDRGTFKASEMRQVGEMYDKLSHFLKVVQEQAQQARAQAAANELPPDTPKGDF